MRGPRLMDREDWPFLLLLVLALALFTGGVLIVLHSGVTLD